MLYLSKKQFYRILIVGNLEKLAKNRYLSIICHIDVKPGDW